MHELPQDVLSQSPAELNQPLIIFYQCEEDGAYVSLLLSNHLMPSHLNEFVERPLRIHQNYYQNPSLQQLIAQGEVPGDLIEKLQLILDEGADTGLLHGLCLPLNWLPLFTAYAPFMQWPFVVIYNELEPAGKETESSLSHQRILRALNQHSHHALVFSAKRLVSDPKFVLRQLSSFWPSKMVGETAVLGRMLFPMSWWESAEKRLDHPHLLEWFTHHDARPLLERTYQQQGVQVIITLNAGMEEKLFWRRMTELHCALSCQVSIVVLCGDEYRLHALCEQGRMYEKYLGLFIWQRVEGSWAAALNAILLQSSAQVFLLDDLRYDFSYADMLFRDRHENVRIVYATLLRNEHRGEAHVSDMLVREQVEGNLLLDASLFSALHGFDEAMDDRFIFWDFALRALSDQAGIARLLPASLMPLLRQEDIQPAAGREDTAYRQFLHKHHELMQRCLDEVIALSGSTHYSNHLEMMQGQEKIASLQLLVSHATDELKAMQQLNAQLHQRIQFLENNWYVKLRSALGRVRKIFFKKKAPGIGTLGRILQFIRFSMSKAGFGILRKVLASVFKKLFLWVENREVEIVYKGISTYTGIYTYHDWIMNKLKPALLEADYEKYFPSLTLKPRISILVPVYNTPLKYLKEAIESVIQQTYPHWELCMVDDCSTEPRVKKLLHSFAVKDDRIRVAYRTVNGHISLTSNDALAMATGDYVLLLDHDDLLAANCLLEIVKGLNAYPQTELLYSDEDKVDDAGHHQQAHFKPDWAPDHLLSRNYMGHVVVLKKTLIDAIGGFRAGFEGSQDYDLLLRASEQTTHILHIPKVLYHWRIHGLSAAQGEDVKPYAYIAAKKALEEALQRRGVRGSVKYLAGLRGYRIDYDIAAEDKVSIIIPTKDQVALLKNTIDSIVEKTDYANYEIIVLNNNSNTKEFEAWRKEYVSRYPGRLQVVDAHFSFNFSRLMNLGHELSTGKHLLLLNNDVEVIHRDWLRIMVSYSQQARIGAVGVRLLYPDDTIQHAGVIVGLGGIAGHTFVGSHREEAGYFNYIQSVNNYSAVTAACLMCRRDAFEQVGGMDEQFEVEYNDVDFCLKLMKAGYNNVYLPQVELYHYESATRGHPHQSKESYERHLKEMKLFKDKWQDVIDHDPFYNPSLNLGVHDFSMNFSA